MFAFNDRYDIVKQTNHISNTTVYKAPFYLYISKWD
jgi:hypothetical protein